MMVIIIIILIILQKLGLFWREFSALAITAIHLIFFFFHPTNSQPSVRCFSKHNQKQLNVETEMTDLIDDWPLEIICV